MVVKWVRFDADVQFKIDIGFGVNPLSTSSTWTSITTDVRQFQVTRGRGGANRPYRPGSMTALLSNTTGRFNPFGQTATSNSASPWPNEAGRPMQPVRVQALYGGTTFEIFRGFLDSWVQQFPAAGSESRIRMAASDGFKILNMALSTSTRAQENSSARFNAILDDVGWTTALRSIGTGEPVLADNPGLSKTALSRSREVSDSIGGHFYMSSSGAVTYKRTRPLGTPAVTFGDSAPAAGESKFQELNIVTSDDHLFNKIEGTLTNSTTVLVQQTTASQDRYVERRLRINDTLTANSSDLSDFLVNVNQQLDDPVPITDITVSPRSHSTGLWSQMLGLELTDVYNLNFQRPGETGHTLLAHLVDSVTHTVDVLTKSWTVNVTGSSMQAV